MKAFIAFAAVWMAGTFLFADGIPDQLMMLAGAGTFMLADIASDFFKPTKVRE